MAVGLILLALVRVPLLVLNRLTSWSLRGKLKTSVITRLFQRVKRVDYKSFFASRPGNGHYSAIGKEVGKVVDEILLSTRKFLTLTSRGSQKFNKETKAAIDRLKNMVKKVDDLNATKHTMSKPEFTSKRTDVIMSHSKDLAVVANHPSGGKKFIGQLIKMSFWYAVIEGVLHVGSEFLTDSDIASISKEAASQVGADVLEAKGDEFYDELEMILMADYDEPELTDEDSSIPTDSSASRISKAIDVVSGFTGSKHEAIELIAAISYLLKTKSDAV